MKAKSVFEHELTELRAKRVENEKALGAERLRASSQARLKDDPNAPTTKDILSSTALSNEHTSTPSPRTNATNDTSSPSAPPKVVSNQIQSQSTLGNPLSIEAPGTPSQADATKDMTKQTIDDLNISGDIVANGLDTSGFTNINSDTDFDSMFADTATLPNDSVNFDLDFSTDQNATQGLLSGNTFGSLGPSSDDFGNVNPASNEDINSLLPGLESYVNEDGENEGDDFTMIDIPMGNAGPDASKIATSKSDITATATENTSMTDTAPLDTNMDDMFDIGDDFGADDTMENIDAFDEWFQGGS